MSIKKFLTQNIKIGFLLFAFLVIYIGAAVIFIQGLPDTPSDPSPIPAPFDILLFAAGHVLVLAWIIARSNWRGWKLVLVLAFTYYGSITFMTQIETWYFLADISVSPKTLRGLFLAGLPTALVFIPLAVLVLGKWKTAVEARPEGNPPAMPAKQWAWKLALVAIAYMALYFSAGYFIAWQNPNLVAFYGGSDPGSFWLQMRNILETSPETLPFQFMRGVLFALFALPVIRMYRGRPWEAAFLVALLLSVPFNIGHLMLNPLMPDASVRFSHMIETASSNFVFGLIIVWLLHRRHESLRDLFGLKSVKTLRPAKALEQAA
jgi:hypothetical protein